MEFHIITLFPEICEAYTSASILGRAQKDSKGKGAKHDGARIAVRYFNPRQYTTDTHHKTDHRPYGGGPGMVMMAEPILQATDDALSGKSRKEAKVLIMSPRGVPFTQSYARSLVKKYTRVVLISGRYEGIDARVKKALRAEEVSIGEYTLTGGELPALIIVDTIARLVPGVLGTYESLEDTRTSTGEMYTRPETVHYKEKKYRVPAVLRNGDHKAIEAWRHSSVTKRNA